VVSAAPLYNPNVAQGVPLVSYVLVNWHTEELLPRALRSIQAQEHTQHEIILVDNASPDFDEVTVSGIVPLTIIRNTRNRGFAAANNQGIAASRGDYVVLLNCDAYLDSGFTAGALAVFESNPRIGTVVPKILRDDGSDRIDSCGHLMHLDRTPVHRGRNERDQGQYDAGGFVFGGTAAAVMYRREMLEVVVARGSISTSGQVFDESFFAYYEDVDLDWRASLAGWRAYYEPRCRAFHRGHGSGGRASYLIRLRAEKNRYLMMAKNDTLAEQLRAWPSLALYECWHGLWTIFRPWLWPAYLVLLWLLPAAWAYRWQARQQRVIPPRQVTQLFVPRGLKPPPRAAPPSSRHTPLLETQEERIKQDADVEPTYPLISVIILNHNGLALTKACLIALESQTYDPVEIIVVDNGSVVDEADLLAIDFPSIRTLRLDRNHGFTGGVNWGLSIANGEFIALLNNDSITDPNCLRHLVYAARRTGAAAVSGRLVDIRRAADVGPVLNAIDLEQDRDEPVVGGVSAEQTAALVQSRRNHGLSLYGYIVSDTYGTRAECFYPSGGLCLLKRAAIDDVLPELFPHFYFAYHEDVYLGFRLRAHDRQVVKESRAAVVHLAGSTARRLGRARLRFYQERNRVLNMVAWLPWRILWRLTPFCAIAALGSGLSLLVSKPSEFLGWLAAHCWFWMHLVSVFRWRQQCQAEVEAKPESYVSELSGQVRGRGGLLNVLSLWWCRLLNIPCREHAAEAKVKGNDKHETAGGR